MSELFNHQPSIVCVQTYTWTPWLTFKIMDNAIFELRINHLICCWIQNNIITLIQKMMNKMRRGTLVSFMHIKQFCFSSKIKQLSFMFKIFRESKCVESLTQFQVRWEIFSVQKDHHGKSCKNSSQYDAIHHLHKEQVAYGSLLNKLESLDPNLQ